NLTEMELKKILIEKMEGNKSIHRSDEQRNLYKALESTLQVVYDVLRRSPFFKAFLVTADVPEIYMQEFWATTYVHQLSIIFKMDKRKNIVDLEAFREMLHISPRVPDQTFNELPFEEEILDFLRFLGHSAQIKTLTDVNVNKLFQSWRSFAAVINKCLTGKSSGFDSLRLSQAQILWGLYHKRNIDYAYLIWEDFVYQVKHKKQKKSNEMYYPRFTKVIIHHFMMKKHSIPRRNKVNWHYFRNDILFLTIKVAYKEYYACATREAVPKPKASARRKRGGFDSSTTPPTAVASPRPITTVAAAPRLTAAAKGKQPARATSPQDPSEVERTKAEQLKIILRKSRQETHISQHGGSSTDEGTGSKPGVLDTKKDDDDDNDDDDDEEEIAKLDEQEDTESGEGDAEETKSDGESEEEETKEEEEESFDPIPRTPEDSKDDGNGEEDQGLKVREEQRLIEEEEADELYRVESIFTTASSTIAPLQTSTPIMAPSTIATITTSSEAPIPPTTIPSAVLKNLPTFESVFRFEDRVKSLEVNFSEFMQTNQFAEAVSNIPENDEFLRTIDENMKKIIKGQVKSQVKEQVSRILPRIEESVNAQLEAEMEGNKSIQRSDEQRNLYNVLVDAYEADKTILESYGDTSVLKRRHGDDDDQEGPSVGSDRGSKRRREGGEPESASTPSEPTTRRAGRSTTGTQSRQMPASESAFAKEPVQTTCQMDEPPQPVFETGAEDQPIVQTSQHPEWFSQPRKPPT
nr:hypothetical protein [Tanacetum cinerariifolium]